MSGRGHHFEQDRPGRRRCVIIGAGPAGLAAAYELSETGVVPIVLEQDGIVGGIARTVEHDGYRFDIGGHRFFSKVQLINEWWDNILQHELKVKSRLSRIYYNGRFFDYPLRPFNALRGLGPIEAFRIAVSYAKARFFPYNPEKSFEEWVCNRFGRRLFEIFFKSYTEKVWGMKCSEIGADWAAQRIKNLDLFAAVRDMLLRDKHEITTLIRQFRYPRLGPGMMWERVAEKLENLGFPVQLHYKVTKLHLSEGRLAAVSATNAEGEEVRVDGTHFISTMPIKELIAALEPAPPKAVVNASQGLRYRDFLTVNLVVNKANVFDDNWVYVHSPKVKVGRIQNFKNWSPDMVPDSSRTSLGLEYFVDEGDDLWAADDQSLIELAKQECSELGLIDDEQVEGGLVIRTPKAYPIYDKTYKKNLSVIRNYLESIPNLQLVGRNGQHRYNNQDHSMLTGIYAARNVCGAEIDIWNVNLEAEYHEHARDLKPARTGERLVPEPLGIDE